MIIHASIIIVICFKEIFSWNSVSAENIHFPFYAQRSSRNVKFVKRSLNGDENSTTVSVKFLEKTITFPLSNNSDSDSSSINENGTQSSIELTATTPATETTINLLNITTTTTTIATSTDVSPKVKLSSSTSEEIILTTPSLVPVTEITINQNTSVTKSSIPDLPSTAMGTSTTNTTTLINSNNVSTTTEMVTPKSGNETSTTEPEDGHLRAIHYILIALSILVIICLIAYGLYHFYRKEQVRRLRLQLMPVYNFDPTESDDWENNLLEEEFSLRSKDKEKKTTTSPGATISISEETSSAPLRQRSNVPVTHL